MTTSVSYSFNPLCIDRVEAKLEAARKELKDTKERLNYKEIEVEKAKAAVNEVEEKRKTAAVLWRTEKDKLEVKVSNLEQEVSVVSWIKF